MNWHVVAAGQRQMIGAEVADQRLDADLIGERAMGERCLPMRTSPIDVVAGSPWSGSRDGGSAITTGQG